MAFYKKLKRILLYFFVALVVAASSFYIWMQDKYVVPIMMYHSVDYEYHHLEESGNVVRPEYFRQHMEYLKKFKYNVIGVDELIEGIKSGRRFPHNNVVITFDDGYVDNYVYALPILKEYHYPFMLAIISDLIGKEGFLTWDQVKEMAQAGAIIVSHSRTHAYLPMVSREKQYDEIVNSKKIIEQKLGIRVKYFVYPIGGFTGDIKKIVKEAGYEAAFTTNRGYDRYNKDVYELDRIRFGKHKPNPYFLRLKLSGFYNFFRESKPGY